MDGYEDFSMKCPRGGEVVTGICHSRGPNADLPPQWLMYVTVESIEDSAKRCVAMGGKLIDGPRGVGDGRFCVIQDPAGAVVGLYSQ